MTQRPLLAAALLLSSGLALAGTVLAARADGPADNIPEKVRPVPPPGVAVPAADRAALEAGLAELGRAIEALRGDAKAAPHLPDVQIYHNAVRYALQFNEFFAERDIPRARALLTQGSERARLLAAGQTPWLTQPGPSARGYLSRIDGSVQPYGLYVPDTFSAASPRKWRLDAWFHGRGETLSEVNFIDGAQRGGGPFLRPDTFVLQPYGRYCNANKLAGESDLFEALDAIRKQYRIDPNRLVMRGFSMGGAACWQFASHYAADWAAAAPGAGFSETPDFLKVFQRETLKPTWWEQKLWQLYDSPHYSANYYNLPLVVYSGEIDSQKQAADVMEKALAAEGIRMVHLIGPKTAHAYHRDSIPEINARIDSIVEKGRNPMPEHVKLATPTLKYNRQAWVTVDALGRHWDPARVDAEIVEGRGVRARTSNVTAISFVMPSGYCPFPVTEVPAVTLDGQKLAAPAPLSDRSWTARFRKSGGRWMVTDGTDDSALRKRHDLQGPIDDAFMDSFMIVRPTGTPAVPGITKWVDAELQHAITEWRRQFRGEARIKNDVDVTDADIARHNLALWGDPGSNRILARLADRLPIRWTADGVVVGTKRYPASHVPLLVYPNPLNPKKYVVLNSGFTYREYDYLNNARQNAKLPDWAIVDTTTPPNSRYPGKVVDAAFFGEQWELVEERR